MPRNHRRTMAVFFATHGEGPWKCYFCGKMVKIIGQNTWDGNVHHVDENASNDSPQNVVMTHVVCHQRYHGPKSNVWETGHIPWNRGQRASSEAVTKMRASKQANPPFLGKHHTVESREKIGAAHRGKVVSEETRQKLRSRVISNETRIKQRVAQKKRVTCETCGYTSSKTWVARHTCKNIVQ